MKVVYVSWTCPDCGWEHARELKEVIGPLQIVTCVGCDREFKVDEVSADVSEARP